MMRIPYFFTDRKFISRDKVVYPKAIAFAMGHPENPVRKKSF